MTIRMYLNGRPAGFLQFSGGHALVSPEAWGVIPRLPVTIFPSLDPTHSLEALVGMSGRPIVLPGIGVLTVEVTR